MRDRIRWDKDAAGRLLIFDYSETTQGEALALFELWDSMVRAEPLASVRALVMLENGFHSPEMSGRWKAASASQFRHSKAVAVIGVHGGIKLAVEAYFFYLRLRRIPQKLRVFNLEAEARTWLQREAAGEA